MLPLSVLSSFLAVACSLWPEKGRGGLAEYHRQTLGPEDGLYFDFELLSRHLDVLVLEGAQRCFPATVVEAKQRQSRIGRELLGGLEGDAATDLVVQRHRLAELERQLDYAIAQNVCAAELSTGYADSHNHIHDLLNSDNQFAFDSAELNPKYLGRLAEAAGLPREYSHIQLRIIGHADAVGEQAHNQSLSHALSRSHAIYKFLDLSQSVFTLKLRVKIIRFFQAPKHTSA